MKDEKKKIQIELDQCIFWTMSPLDNVYFRQCLFGQGIMNWRQNGLETKWFGDKMGWRQNRIERSLKLENWILSK